MRLTDQFLKGLAPRDDRYEIADDACIGLRIRVSKQGKKTWSLVVWNAGLNRPVRVTLGEYPKIGLKEARDLANQKRDGASAPPAPEASFTTYAEVVEAFIKLYAKPNKKSWAKDEAYLKRSKEEWGALDASTITRKMIVSHLDEIATRGPVTANRTKTVMSKMLSWAADREMIPANPIATWKEKPGGKELPKQRVLTDEEVRSVWTSTPATVAGNALRLILTTAQRPGEACAARCEQFELDAEPPTWVLPGSSVKNGMAHKIPLTPQAVAILRLAIHGRAEGWVFEGRGKPFQDKPHIRNETVISLCQVKGVAHFTPHDLRRTAATAMRTKGAAVSDIGALLNHSEKSITAKVYALSDRMPEKLRAIEALALWLSAIDIKA